MNWNYWSSSCRLTRTWVMPDMVHDVRTDTLKANDIILVKPGEKVAADGIILEGESYLNESMLTGESKPILKVKGDKVIAGSINGNGSFQSYGFPCG